MKSINNIIMFQNLQADVWGYATNLLGILQWFDGEGATDKAITQGLLVDDAKDRFEMWCNLVNDHYNTWTDWMNAIDLDSVDRELFDDCPDNTSLTNRLRIVKLRAGTMWGKTDYDILFDGLLHSFFRLKALILATYDMEEEDAHKMAKQIHDNLTQKLINVKRLQDYVQSIISQAEQILNPQPTQTEKEVNDPIFDKWDLFEDEWVVLTFQDLIKEKILSIDNGYFRWQWDRSLLLWFCKQISEYCGLTTIRNGKAQISWITFNDMFICKVWDKWQVQSNKDLRGAWQDWQKNADSELNPNGTEGKLIPPKGWNVIEGIICDNFKH